MDFEVNDWMQVPVKCSRVGVGVMAWECHSGDSAVAMRMEAAWLQWRKERKSGILQSILRRCIILKYEGYCTVCLSNKVFKVSGYTCPDIRLWSERLNAVAAVMKRQDVGVMAWLCLRKQCVSSANGSGLAAMKEGVEELISPLLLKSVLFWSMKNITGNLNQYLFIELYVFQNVDL